MLKLSQPITSINGFKIGDKVRLKDGDGRPHIIKSFSIDGMKEFFFEVQFEDGTEAMLDNIAPLPSNLDEAAKEYNRNYIPFDQCDSRDIMRAFKAGAEWMSLQSTRARLAVKANTPEGKDAYEKAAKEMRASVAAKDYGEGIYCPILKHKNKTGLNCTAVEDAFLKGAEWMAGQGVTSEGEILDVPGMPLVDKVIRTMSIKDMEQCLKDFNKGDKVVVQIRKK